MGDVVNIRETIGKTTEDLKQEFKKIVGAGDHALLIWEPKGDASEFFSISTDITRADALFLLEKAKMHVMGLTDDV